MNKSYRLILTLAFSLAAFSLTVLVSWGILLSVNLGSFQSVLDILQPPFSSVTKTMDVIMQWLPILLSIAAVLVTFRAGFWNIGVEGQIIIGAISATWAVRILQGGLLPSFLIIIIVLGAGAIGGAIWAFFSALIKTQTGVHEIINGFGLNLLAIGIINWLVLGPWQRSGAGTVAGTDMFLRSAWLPVVPDLRISILAVVIALTIFIFVAVLINRTKFGLRLFAFKSNPRAKYLHASFTNRTIWRTFFLSGMIAGVTGAILVTGTYHRLIPSVSAGVGYIGILIVLMVQFNIWAAALVGLIFSLITINSVPLAMSYQIDPSFAGVFQGIWAIFTIIALKIREKLLTGNLGR